ncbi:FAD-dependent monooxygenase [Sciscionella sediminilitoris]|uniref:FAD-dependent monooxygenase n=1 Tax=Sciscionella sediminilitoris TaxID=1445613 RepID=UPI0004DF25F5|nr:FAD-dependent monooxygenase [Sciscionella sp. SE31]
MRILVSGAGVAGLSAAIDLGRAGNEVTIVERANHLRVNGSPIDIRGTALDIAAEMGVLERIRDSRLDMSERLQFVDASGTPLAAPPAEEVSDSAEDLEIAREDLARLLYEALPTSVTLVFEESIGELEQDADGVTVRFSSGGRERYDLVVGADGLHSRTRSLTFGPERDLLRHLGFYVALAEFPGARDDDPINPMYNFPGHLAGIAKYRDHALAVFQFRAPWIEYDHHDLEAQREILRDHYGRHRQWRVPELLEAACADPELYFDSVSLIEMDSWHRGRVALVGDAAHCASPLSGRGTSLALTGAWFLSEALREYPADLERALAEYEDRQRPHVTRAQATAGPGGDLMLPATQEEIDARNARLSGQPADSRVSVASRAT